MGKKTELLNTVSTVRRRLLLIGFGAALVWSLFAAIILMVVLAWVDLVLELPSGTRAGAWGASAILGGCVLFRMMRSGLMDSTVQAVAQRLDATTRSCGQILSGVELAEVSISDSSLSLTDGLAGMAITRAHGLASAVNCSQAAPIRAVYPAVLSFGLLAGLIVIACLGMSRMVMTQWQRFTDPYGDHPPYSRIVLSVEPGDATVVYGRGLEVRVQATGGIPERVELVLVGENGDSERLPMFPEAADRWRAAITQITSTQQYIIRADTTRSRRYFINVVTVPRLEAVRFRVTPPAYTRRNAYEGTLPQGGLAGLPRTRVDVWARSNRPLSSGSIAFTPKSVPTMDPAGRMNAVTRPAASMSPLADAYEVTGAYTLDAAGQIEIRVTDTNEQVSQDSFIAPVTLLADERPFVRIAEPPAESLASPTAVVPIAIIAEDDYGISKLQLFRSLNDSRPRPMEVPVGSKTPTRVTEVVKLELAKYGLEPGDTIKLFARVEDNDPEGPKGSESTIATLHILSQAEYERLLRVRQGLEVFEAKYQEARRRLESLDGQIKKLQEELSKTSADAELTARQRELLDKLLKDMAESSDELRKSAAIDLPYDLDRKLTSELEKLAAEFAKAEKEAETESTKKPFKNEQARRMLQNLQSRITPPRHEYETKAMLPMEHLRTVYPLIEDQARFIVLYQRQRELSERAAALKGHDREDNPAQKNRMRELEADQKDLEQALVELLENIDNHTSQLPEDHRVDQLRKTATDFVKAVRASGVSEAMSDTESAMAEFLGTQAAQRSKDAADILEKFISRCQGMSGEGQACLKFNPALSSCLGDTVQQLLDEAGLGSARGRGQGGGAGYSAQRSTLQNMGLYGSMPALGNPTRSGSGGNRSAAIGRNAHGMNRGRPGTAAAPFGRPLEGTGGGEADIPIQYRHKVGRYFERVADELGE